MNQELQPVTSNPVTNNFKTISSSFISEFPLLVATIKTLNKFCNLFPSSNAVLFTKNRRKLLFTFAYLLMINLLVIVQVQQVLHPALVLCRFFQKRFQWEFFIHSLVSYHLPPCVHFDCFSKPVLLISNPLLFWNQQYNLDSADLTKILIQISQCNKNTCDIEVLGHIVKTSRTGLYSTGIVVLNGTVVYFLYLYVLILNQS